jgi:hypothetical protein
MSGTNMNQKANVAATRALDQARRAAAQAKPVAAQVTPLAKSAQAAAERGVQRTRAWAAPQFERTGQVLQDSVAPKISAALSSAADRIRPVEPQRRPWRTLAGISVVLTAAVSAVAALALRKKPGSETTSAAADTEEPMAAQE